MSQIQSVVKIFQVSCDLSCQISAIFFLVKDNLEIPVDFDVIHLSLFVSLNEGLSLNDGEFVTESTRVLLTQSKTVWPSFRSRCLNGFLNFHFWDDITFTIHTIFKNVLHGFRTLLYLIKVAAQS